MIPWCLQLNRWNWRSLSDIKWNKLETEKQKTHFLSYMEVNVQSIKMYKYHIIWHIDRYMFSLNYSLYIIIYTYFPTLINVMNSLFCDINTPVFKQNDMYVYVYNMYIHNEWNKMLKMIKSKTKQKEWEKTQTTDNIQC